MSLRPRPTKDASPRSRRLVAAIAALITVAIAVAVAGVVGFFVYFAPGPAARQGATTTVVLRPGAGIEEIGAELQRAGVIGSQPLFVLGAELSGSRRMKAGEYAFASHASMATVIALIASGKVVRHFITIPEGVTAEFVSQALAKADYLTGDAPTPAEGAVLPETYEARRGDDRAAVLKRMMDARDRLLAQLWAHRRSDLPFRTPEEAVILASIVEKETGKADDRPRIAAVFVNRLKAGMPLQSDPTVIYGLTGGEPLGRVVTYADLASDTPYNTYKVRGLPPGPIGNPGRAALAAVLDPPRTSELYFVANGSDGGSSFSSNLTDHTQNVGHYRQVEACQAAAKKAGKPAKC